MNIYKLRVCSKEPLKRHNQSVVFRILGAQRKLNVHIRITRRKLSPQLRTFTFLADLIFTTLSPTFLVPQS